MEPRREEQVKREESRPEPKRKRFRIEKLEERIAPGGKKLSKGKCGTGTDAGTGSC